MFNSPNKSVGVINGGPPQGKNLIINGNLTVDQRGVYTEYVADRWKIVDANNMTQIIEDLNFEPSTEYTLSWEGGTPQQITSPASGHWTLPNIPRTARKIQLEKGDKATEFEWEDVGTTLRKCQRYFQYLYVGFPGVYSPLMYDATIFSSIAIFFQEKRILPTIDHDLICRNARIGDGSVQPATFNQRTLIFARFSGLATPGGNSGDPIHFYGNIYIDAEIPA